MRLSLYIPLLFLTVPVTVFACEGECIVAITNAFLGNYSNPVRSTLDTVAQRISDIMPSQPGAAAVYESLKPLLTAYNRRAYIGMETAIFPRYFHGKCQQHGVNPPGCPNPDCPVVCGTPGSMVHFYSTLTEIAFNQTHTALVTLAAPGSLAYAEVERSVMGAAWTPGGRFSRIYPRSSAAKVASGVHSSSHSGSSYKAKSGYQSTSVSSPNSTEHSSGGNTASDLDSGHELLVPVFKKRSQDVQDGLKQIMESIGDILENACGGAGWPECSWEQPMKEYILTFP